MSKIKLQMFCSISILMFIGCDSDFVNNETDIKSKEHCDFQKKEIEESFKLKKYSKTIELFVEYQDCYANDSEYLYKLGLLYKLNGQIELSKKTLNKSIQKLNKSKELSENEIAIIKAGTYLIMGNKNMAMKEIKKVNKSKLTEVQKEELSYLEIFASQGEYIALEYNVDFELFDK